MPLDIGLLNHYSTFIKINYCNNAKDSHFKDILPDSPEFIFEMFIDVRLDLEIIMKSILTKGTFLLLMIDKTYKTSK